ncbi:phage tail tube protein [Streptomyces sp. IBSNAI002]|uniref:phage tail tube protein n=1 Tax=Streptomyces sp. IBSNAI002 TaxID=3457500 RepID=UPI003FD04584
MILRKGDIPSSRSRDVFPVRIGSRSPQHSVDNQAARFTFTFSITGKPLQDVVVPPAAPTALPAAP